MAKNLIGYLNLLAHFIIQIYDPSRVRKPSYVCHPRVERQAEENIHRASATDWRNIVFLWRFCSRHCRSSPPVRWCAS